MTKGIYSFYWDCGRSGELTGLFIATEERMKEVMGRSLYFGEVLGKHSEVYGTLNEDDVELITTDEIAISIVEKYKLTSGFNPLLYLKDEEDEE